MPSRVRTRPTREATRSQLFRAAAEVFEARGIGSASLDAIASAAGLTRGAVYSNFADKDDLVLAMLEDHSKRALRHYRELAADHGGGPDLVEAMRRAERDPDDPLGRSPLLQLELILYVARSKDRRPELAERLRAGRALIAEMVTAAGGAGPMGASEAAAILLALEDGLRLHQLIDPETTTDDSFLDAVAALQRLLGPRGAT